MSELPAIRLLSVVLAVAAVWFAAHAEPAGALLFGMVAMLGFAQVPKPSR